ncbi:MAG: hypothetical protein SGILL_002479 [Bacillariaceae sp.]
MMRSTSSPGKTSWIPSPRRTMIRKDRRTSSSSNMSSPFSFTSVLIFVVLVGSAIIWTMEPTAERTLSGETDTNVRGNNFSKVSDTTTDQRDSSQTVSATIDKDIDWSDTIFQHFESDNDPIVLESHKLLFFSIPKNSCTEWKQLFRRMMGYDNWNKIPFLHPHDPRTNGLTYLGTYDKAKQEEIMTSPEWTRAMFVRDPLERMLSAYLNKGLSEERYIKKWCCKIAPRETDEERRLELEYLQQHNTSCVPLAPWEPQPTAETFSFDTFINEFMFQCNDKHWRPQSQRMFPQNWKFLNFIGRMDNLHEDAKNLLERVGAWNEFGSNGWGKYQNMSMFERARSDSTNTHSKDRVAQFYTPELKKKALEYLKGDYENEWLNFQLPDDTTTS